MSQTGAAVVFGASGGIGQALVQAIANSGDYAAVYAGSREGTTHLPGVQGFRFDLRDEASLARAMSGIGEPVTLAIVATGILHDARSGIAPEKNLRSLDAGVLSEVMAVNAIGPALIAKHCLPRFPRQERAVFAALSARVGSITDNRFGGWHAYRASKAALNMLVRTFAIELARTHPAAVAVTLHPGTVATRLSEPFRKGGAPNVMAPAQSAQRMLVTLRGLRPADSGGLFAYDGEKLPF